MKPIGLVVASAHVGPGGLFRGDCQEQLQLVPYDNYMLTYLTARVERIVLACVGISACHQRTCEFKWHVTIEDRAYSPRK